MSTPRLSIIIPSYNEMTNIERGVLTEIYDYLKNVDYGFELILSDDGSTDGTAAQLDKFAATHKNVTVLHNPHAGKGPTVQSGMLAAKGEWRLFTDFDQSTPISEIAKFWPHTDSYPIVIGSREGKGAVRDKEPIHRHIMGRGFNLLVQFLAIPGILDTQCGFKLFRGDVAEKLFSSLVIYGRKEERSDAFTGAFDVELLFLAIKYGIPIKEIPITWHHFETNRVSPIRDSVRMLRDILFIRLEDIKRSYPKIDIKKK